MGAVGVHLSRRGARAVVIDAAGRPSAAATVESADAAAAVREAVRKIEAANAEVVGLAVDPAEQVDVAAVKRALAESGSGNVSVVGAGTAAIAAETWKGAAQGARHAVCLWVGETVLAGILLDGQPWSGAHGYAGSAAWLALNPVERQDYRKFGSLAAEVSNMGIARRLAWRIQAGDHSAVLERAGDLEAITGTHVFEGARTGDGVSISVVRDAARYIGMAVANLASTLDPDVVVVAGPLAQYGDLLLEPIRQECARRLLPALAEQFRCEMSPFGEDGIAIGAAHLAETASR